MALINAALLLPYTVTFHHDKPAHTHQLPANDKPQNDKLLLPLPTQLQQQPHSSNPDPDLPFDFATKKPSAHSAPPPVQKNIVDDRKKIDVKPQVATASNRDTIRRRRGLSVGGTPSSHFRLKRQHGGNGSLFNAISRAKQRQIISQLKWVGLTGVPTDHVLEPVRQRMAESYLSHDCHPVYVQDQDYVGHYDHYCKDILFPTFHCQVPEIPKSKSYEDLSWQHYQNVNRHIADKIISVYKRGDYIWIHDYHLMLVPAMVRAALLDAPIGFFMHVSFPTSEVFRCLAHRAPILSGVLASNCVGFQNDEYAQHFMMTSSRILAYDASKHCVQTHDLDVHIFVCPIGIDPERLTELKDTPRVAAHRRKIRARWPTAQIIGARDKLDPTKGIVPKLRAYGALLDSQPQLAASTVFIQICLPSVGGDPELESEIASIADAINTKHGDLTAGIHPLVVLHQDVVFEQYLALIAEADVFAVTSLRDGMNLTCHEFVYCNERDGPLVLSEFTGSASVLTDSILVNPWDKNGMREAFQGALGMSGEERGQRSQRLASTIRSHTCIEWVTQCFEQMDKAWHDDQARHAMRPDIGVLGPVYNSWPDKKRLITFEIPVGNAALYGEPQEPEPGRPPMARQASLHSTARGYYGPRMNLTISKLLEDPRNIVYVSSAESQRFMERCFRQLPSVGLIAESGRYLRLHNTDKWLPVAANLNLDWQQEIKPILGRMQERLPVKSLDVHENTVVIDFNFDGESQERQLATIGEYVSLIDDAFAAAGLQCHFEHRQLVVYPLELIGLRTKALSMVLDSIDGEIGPMVLATQPLATFDDDVLFTQLLDMQAQGRVKELVTVIYGGHPSLARYRVSGVNALMTLLLQLDVITCARSAGPA